MKKMVKSVKGKNNYNNRKLGKGNAVEVIFRNDRGKIIFQFHPANHNVEKGMRVACDFAERKLGVNLFKNGIILTDHSGKPTNIPNTSSQHPNIGKVVPSNKEGNKEEVEKPFDKIVASALSQIKGIV